MVNLRWSGFALELRLPVQILGWRSVRLYEAFDHEMKSELTECLQLLIIYVAGICYHGISHRMFSEGHELCNNVLEYLKLRDVRVVTQLFCWWHGLLLCKNSGSFIRVSVPFLEGSYSISIVEASLDIWKVIYQWFPESINGITLSMSSSFTSHILDMVSKTLMMLSYSSSHETENDFFPEMIPWDPRFLNYFPVWGSWIKNSFVMFNKRVFYCGSATVLWGILVSFSHEILSRI